MDIDPQIFKVVQMITVAISGAIGYALRALWESHQKTIDSLNNLKESLPQKYVPKNEFKDSIDSIFSMLRRIEDKLDHKVDKS
jgi:hypothetical protein